MSIIKFPTDPVLDQVYTYNGKSWKWSGVAWKLYVPTPIMSAYQIAVANGFVGTEPQWLLSLKGADGRSAYQIAVENGFQGSEEQWLLSLKGENGDPGNGGGSTGIYVPPPIRDFG